MLRIMRYLSKAEIGQMLIALVSIIGQIWLDLTLPDYMSNITELVETPGSSMSDIWVAGGKMLAISLGSAACAVVTGYIAARVGASFSQRLRSLEFNKVESFGPAEMNRFSTASLITRSTNDITQIQMFITMGLMMIVKSPIMAVWAVCKIAGDGFEWTLATGIAVAVLLVAIGILMALVMPKFKSMQRLTDNINLVARENLTGLRVVRAYNAEDYQESKFTQANKELTETQLFTNRAMAVMMPLMNTIMNGLMLAVYWIGAYLIEAADATDKLTTFANMVVFSSYSVQVIMSFLLMSMVFVLWPRADVSAQRVLEVIDTEPMVVDGSRTAGKSGMEGDIEFRNVSFAYPDSREAMLEGISFKAAKGQTVAFIGSTGSGKSSLINLVPRFYDGHPGRSARRRRERARLHAQGIARQDRLRAATGVPVQGHHRRQCGIRRHRTARTGREGRLRCRTGHGIHRQEGTWLRIRHFARRRQRVRRAEATTVNRKGRVSASGNPHLRRLLLRT